MTTDNELLKLLQSQELLSALGSAVGGFVGIVAFFAIRAVIEWIRSKPRLLQTYYCVGRVNRGAKDEQRGELQHHTGRLIESKEELGKLGAKQELWAWSRDRAGDCKGQSVFFGPYCTDLSEPGMYAVRFYFRAQGFTRPEEVTRDYPLLTLDVLRTVSETVLDPKTGSPVQLAQQEVIAFRHITLSQVASSGWQNVELRLSSDGKGVWEFRCFAFDGVGYPEDNFGKCGEGVRVYFDKVELLKLRPFNLPWA